MEKSLSASAKNIKRKYPKTEIKLKCQIYFFNSR